MNSNDDDLSIDENLFEIEDLCDEDDNITLHFAAYCGQSDVVKHLITKGYFINKKDDDGQTALHIAARPQNVEAQYEARNIAELLIINGANINAKNNDGKTPLHIATYYGNRDVFELLIRKRADIYAKDKNGHTAFDSLIFSGRSFTKETVKIAQLLIANGFDINAKSGPNGTSHLFSSVSAGREYMTKMLILLGANVETMSDRADSIFYGQTPLHVATEKGHKNIASILINNGANINAKDPDGETPLHIAAYCGETEIAELLIFHGADINATDRYGYRPLAYAYRGYDSLYKRSLGNEQFRNEIGRILRRRGGIKHGWFIHEHVIRFIQSFLANH